jgi:radical SAM enzyme (TIGR01210 family)
MPDAAAFPTAAAARDRFVLDRRGARPAHDPWRHQGVLVEDERTADGGRARIATAFLTGRECPWRCTMCDLWRYTTVEDTPRGAIPAQVAAARAEAQAVHGSIAGMKLYKAGSFFDPGAVPVVDYDAVAAALAGIPHVIVESHPALVDDRRCRVDRFLESLAAASARADTPTTLEVAIGLETAHPDALDRLNKRFTVDDFRRAATALVGRGIAVRVFLLIAPPFVPAFEQDDWLRRSLDVSFASGASVVSLVPTRPGNGAIEALSSSGLFRMPALADVERSIELALAHANTCGRVFVDLWDLERFAACRHCLALRRARLHLMNLDQRVLPPPSCPAGDGCGAAAP